MSAATLSKTIGLRLPTAVSPSSRSIIRRCASCLAKSLPKRAQILSTSSFVNTMSIVLNSGSPSDAQLAAEAEKYILMDRHNDKGVITLNRPKALNALNYHMAHRLEAGLKVWDRDSQIRMILIKSASEKAFCAGGDVKAISQESSTVAGKKFFRQEYTLNNLIGSLSVPYVALIDGICMGGGCGLSVHGNFRVVTEKALFAMPETAIGLFPDVGASHFLNKLPGSLGLYFALTGARMQGRDLFKAGIGTHFIPSDKLDNLQEELLRLEKPDLLKIDHILQKYQEQWQDEFRKEFSLKPHMGRINGIFGGAKRVEEVFSGLEKDNSEWARKTLETLVKMSPTSLKLSFEQLRRAKSMTLPECLKMEYRMACRVLEKSEFYEGVRAMLIERDNKPKWNPSKLEEVTEAQIKAYFEPLPRSEELQL